MNRLRWLLPALSLLIISDGESQPPKSSGTPPRLAAVAETKLLMEGLAVPNIQGVERILKQDEIEAESWLFARGQSLLIAETGNLLMIRPPRNSGQDAWMSAAATLRESSSQLARALGSKDRQRSTAALTQVANACNNCHQTFRVSARVTVFGPAVKPKPPTE